MATHNMSDNVAQQFMYICVFYGERVLVWYGQDVDVKYVLVDI